MGVDGLTGLPTWREVAAGLGPWERPFAVFFDIDALIRLTDMCGYVSSDEAIVRTARIIRDAAAALGAPTFRVGGDEFLVLLEGQTHAQALALAKSAVAAVSAARIEYQRADDPTRQHLAVNAVVARVTAQIGPQISAARDWFAGRIWEAKQHDHRRFEVIADAGENLPPWAAA